jgi:hypothetical protein
MVYKKLNSQIDKGQWDKIVELSDYSRIYGLSWYLDIVSPKWQGLVSENYKWIMPLPVKFKFGIRYLVQPVFCQQIGVYGIGIKKNIASQFYSKIYWKFPYINVQINNFTGLEKRKYLNGRINYELDLTSTYEVLVKDYTENTLRNIKKAEKLGIFIEHCSMDEFITFCKSHAMGISDQLLEILSKLILACMDRKLIQILKASNLDKEILSAACYIVWNKRIIYLAGASSAPGKKLSSMFMIFDFIIKKYAASGYILDFEGSMIPGIARFFRGFGAKSTYYYTLKKYLFWFR